MFSSSANSKTAKSYPTAFTNLPIGDLSRFLKPARTGEYVEPSVEVVQHRILIVEENRPLARLLANGLATRQIAVDVANDAAEAARRIDEQDYVVVVLGIERTSAAAIEQLKSIRAKLPAAGVLVLTGQGSRKEMIDILDQGADDYLPKPFSLLEMMARVRALQRRAGVKSQSSAAMKGLVLNRSEYRVERCGRKIDLTPREFALLEFLVENPGKTLSRSTLMQAVWNMTEDANTNIVDVYMKYLRDKLDGQGEESLIRTVRGVGYLLNHQETVRVS